MADPRVLNEVIWFSVRGAKSPLPEIARLPAFDAMRAGLDDTGEELAEQWDAIRKMRALLARNKKSTTQMNADKHR